MEYIAHRINTIEELRVLPEEYGVELDLRDFLDGSIYIQHNPFETGENFENYLREYHHGTMILNVKSERIEFRIQELLEKYRIKKYFFLDSSFPMIFLLSTQGEKNIALRLSELEGMDTIRNMSGRVKWIWIDCFTKIPINKKEYDELKLLGYKLCFVSPELENRSEDIGKYANWLANQGMRMDAVCTKVHNINQWKRIYYGK